MKKMIRGSMTTAAAVLALCMVLAIAGSAYAGSLPNGVDPSDHDICTVKDPGWDLSSPNGLTLRQALLMQKDYETYEACGKKIIIPANITPVIKSPILITRDNFTLEGLCEGSTCSSIDMKKMNVGTGSDIPEGMNSCGLIVQATGVSVKYLSLSGSGNNEHSGVCISGAGNKFRRVQVSGVKNGFKFFGDTEFNVIAPNSSTMDISGYGIDLSSAAAQNAVVMSNVKPAKDGDGEAVDGNGMVENVADNYFSIDQILEEGVAEGSLFSMDNAVDEDAWGDTDPTLYTMSLSGGESLVNSPSKVVPLITSINKISNDDRWHIKGKFKQIDSFTDSDSDGKFDKVDCSGTTYKEITHMAVYMPSLSKHVHVGTVGENATKGIDADKGTFDFYIDYKDAEHDYAVTASEFILVPVNNSWKVMGHSSNKHTLAEGVSDCSTDGDDDDTNGNGFNGFKTVGECNAEFEWSGGQVDKDRDSDQDGIPDYIEMGVMKKKILGVDTWVFSPDDINCDCQAHDVLTCWFKSDSDNDGIRDMADAYNEEIVWSVYDDADGQITLDPQPIDTDKGYASADDKADAQDDDSDNDGLLDGYEDRNRTFNENANAYFMLLGVNGSEWYYDSDMKRVKCNDDLMMVDDDADVPEVADHFRELGVKYALYKAGGEGEDYIDDPIPYTMFTDPSLKTGQLIFAMACVNETVPINANNFDGVLNGTMGREETDARSPDTDQDCVCDSKDNGCKEIDGMMAVGLSMPTTDCLEVHANTPITNSTPQWLNDGCPRVPQPTNDCNPECIPNEIPQAVKNNVYGAPYVEVVGSEIVLKDEDTNGVPDLFEQEVEKSDDETGVTWSEPNWKLVQDACPDIDNDDIPDCVEYFHQLCPEDNPGTNRLDPYKRDTDGDGLLDGVAKADIKADVCPLTAANTSMGQDDELNPLSSAAYSCDPSQVYTGELPKIVSCFFDRDGDNVRDCLEDRNMDGQKAGPIQGIAGIYKSESDPLDTDSDDDGLDDEMEVLVGWPFRTNPRLADTDGDGINDPDEDRDGDMYITKVDRTGMLCQGVGMYDTDPRFADSDGDGLSDSIELVGAIMDPDLFRAMLQDATIWAEGGISHGSDPLAMDSDNDGLKDGEEYDGQKILFYNSNPCITDSDGDTKLDKDELPGCRLNSNPNCIGSEDGTSAGLDSDSDGLSDLVETMLGTDPNNFDTDGDGVKDGQEDTNANGIYEPNLGETNALVADTDGDNVNDGYELRYGTDPTNIDTDGDCIQDGIEDANHNGQFDMGAETNALSYDTDGDGLPDGWVASSGLGEDLDCDGIRDADAEGYYLETDPRNPDSDLDGFSDYEEMTYGGRGFTTNNLSRATQGSEGCSMVGSAGGAPTSMFYLLGVLLAAVKAVAIKRKKASA